MAGLAFGGACRSGSRHHRGSVEGPEDLQMPMLAETMVQGEAGGWEDVNWGSSLACFVESRSQRRCRGEGGRGVGHVWEGCTYGENGDPPGNGTGELGRPHKGRWGLWSEDGR